MEARHLPLGASTADTMVEMTHLAATPFGMNVRARATLLESDGGRYLFEAEAWDETEKIAEGRHTRFVIPNLAKLLERPPGPPPAPAGRAPREAR